jgi:hypothetical protein
VRLGECAGPLGIELLVSGADVTVKPIYGHQEAAVKG